MPDSRLTEPSDGKVYRLREAILLSKRLGRPLTQDEMEQFVIWSNLCKIPVKSRNFMQPLSAQNSYGSNNRFYNRFAREE